jgi:hypothetical protein
VNHGDVGTVGCADRWDHGFRVGLHDDDAVDLAGDHGTNLLELLAVVFVRDAFEHGVAALLHLVLDDLHTGDPELGVEPVEQHRDGLAALRLHQHRRGARGCGHQGTDGKLPSCRIHSFLPGVERLGFRPCLSAGLGKPHHAEPIDIDHAARLLRTGHETSGAQALR